MELLLYSREIFLTPFLWNTSYAINDLFGITIQSALNNLFLLCVGINQLMMEAAECIAECLCSGNSLVYSHFDMDSFQLTDFADVSGSVLCYLNVSA